MEVIKQPKYKSINNIINFKTLSKWQRKMKQNQ